MRPARVKGIWAFSSNTASVPLPPVSPGSVPWGLTWASSVARLVVLIVRPSALNVASWKPTMRDRASSSSMARFVSFFACSSASWASFCLASASSRLSVSAYHR